MGVEVRNISKRYGTTAALQDVSIKVDDGEFVTLLGPSGCGKTTLLRIIAGFLEPDEGDVLIDGKVVTKVSPEHRPTGMVFQSYALFQNMTVADNVSFGLRMRHIPKPERERKVSALLDLAGIREFANRYPKQLSGGQQQRVAVARTLAIEPSVLLLDEPLASLDRKLRIQMRTELKRLVDRVGITSIFVTHDQLEALTMSDRIVVMDHGTVIQCGTPMEIYDNPETEFVASFVGSSNLFRGTVHVDLDQHLILETGGLRLALPPNFDHCLGKEISLLLRPEHLQLAPLANEAKPDDYCPVGMVTRVEHLGVSIAYEIKVDSGQTLFVEMNRMRNKAPIPEGSRVVVSPIDMASFVLVPGQ